jgi:hypothetical protein
MLGLSIRRPRNNDRNLPNTTRLNSGPLNNSNDYAEENVWEVNMGNYKVPIGNEPEYGRGSTEWANKPINLLSPVELPDNSFSSNKNNSLSMPSPIKRPANASSWSINSSFYEPPTQKRKLSRRSNRKSRRTSRKNRKTSRRNSRK